MSGFVTVDVNEVVDGFSAMKDNAKDLRRPFRKFQPVLGADIVDHFVQRQGPDHSWPDWAPSYKKKLMDKPIKRNGMYFNRRELISAWRGTYTAQQNAHVIERDVQRHLMPKMLGRLRGTRAWSVQRQMLLADATKVVRWSFIHQWGGTAGRGSKIPQRQFMWVSEEKLETLAQLILEHLLSTSWKWRFISGAAMLFNAIRSPSAANFLYNAQPSWSPSYPSAPVRQNAHIRSWYAARRAP